MWYFQRSRYPRGFYILSVVQDSDELCREEEPPDVDWLWEAAVLEQRQERGGAAPPRGKVLTLHTRVRAGGGGGGGGGCLTDD